MSWWNARYKNGQGEYEITFASKDYEKAKAVEKVCQAIIDKRIATRDDIKHIVLRGVCDGCAHNNRRRPQKCSCCVRNIDMKDCYAKESGT